MPGPSADLGVDSTLLQIIPLSGALTPTLTPYSARGVTQKTVVTASSQGGTQGAGELLVRDIQGALHDWTYQQFRKYEMEFSCSDTEQPALDGAWIGAAVEVAAVEEWSYPVGGVAERPAVPGSEYTSDGFTYYRPLLTMMVADITTSRREYPAVSSWTIKLREI
jgi:hypothetical protein